MRTALHSTPELSFALDEYKDNGYLTHSLHPYPAKFVPQIPREIVSKLTKPGDWVLDPFCGSGTTLVECNLLGRNAIGTDVNPLSCKIARAKSTRLSSTQLSNLDALLDKLRLRGRKVLPDAAMPSFQGADKWFTAPVQAELSGLLALIRAHAADAVVLNFLEVAFAAIVVKASNQESDTRYKAIDKLHPDGAVVKMFAKKLAESLEKAKEYSACSQTSIVEVRHLDSTAKRTKHKAKFQLAVTSPPYMNSYDYYLYHKHRMNWLGLDVAATQEKEFGSRNKHNDKGLGLDSYNESIARSIALTREQLVDRGYYCVVVGDSIWRGNLIRMNTNYDRLFKDGGYIKVQEVVFPQRKYTRSFTANFRTQHKDSYVLVYAKG